MKNFNTDRLSLDQRT